MRLLFFIILSFFCIPTNAQLILNQPKEDSSVGNVLFSGYEHFFTFTDNIKIQSVEASVGSVYAIDDSSFKYKMPVFISKGNMKFTITYLENEVFNTENLSYKFVPKERYSCKIIGARKMKNQHHSLKRFGRFEISASYFVKNDIEFEVFYDNTKVNATVNCARIAFAPKRGEVALYLISFNNFPCLINEKYGESIKFSIFKHSTYIGDQVIFEELVIQIDNQEKQVKIPMYSILLVE